MGPKILVADDSQLIHRLAHCFLRTRYTTSTAASGEEAFERAVSDQPDLILLDRNIRGGTASATLALLAEDARTRHIPVVVMTTQDRAGLGSNVDPLVKPFDASALIGKLQERLGHATKHQGTSRAAAEVRPARGSRRAA
jgi:twitching motility two-component system response regulator PilH